MGNSQAQKIQDGLIPKKTFSKTSGSFDFNDFVRPESFSVTNFTLFQELGRGAFGEVYLLWSKTNNLWIALKILDKSKVVERKQVVHVNSEKRILTKIDFPFIANIYFGLQSKLKLFLGLEYVCGGELFQLLRDKDHFKEGQAKFYAAQVMLALDYLHHLNIIYRDLKPENILLDSRGYLKIVDFGFAKVVPTRTYTMCGTPEYISPEILKHRGYGKSVDWWAFGVLLYEMVIGFSPFYSSNVSDIYEKIWAAKVRYPKKCKLSTEMKDLIGHLIEPDITKRYGCLKNGVLDIKTHTWFDDTNWGALLSKKVSAPFLVRKVTPKKASKTTVSDLFDEKGENLFHDLFTEFI